MKASLLSAPFLAGMSIASLLLSSVLWNVGTALISTQSLVSIDHLVHACSTATSLLTWLGVTLWSSAWVASKTGRRDLSTQVGFWSGIVLSLILAVKGLLTHYQSFRPLPLLQIKIGTEYVPGSTEKVLIAPVYTRKAV